MTSKAMSHVCVQAPRVTSDLLSRLTVVASFTVSKA